MQVIKTIGGKRIPKTHSGSLPASLVLVADLNLVRLGAMVSELGRAGKFLSTRLSSWLPTRSRSRTHLLFSILSSTSLFIVCALVAGEAVSSRFQIRQSFGSWGVFVTLLISIKGTNISSSLSYFLLCRH